MLPEWARDADDVDPDWARGPGDPGDVELADQNSSHLESASDNSRQTSRADEGEDEAQNPSWYYEENKNEESEDVGEGRRKAGHHAAPASAALPEGDDDPEHRALVVGLVRGRVVWRSGDDCLDCCKDWWFFACQTHPLLDVLFAHPFHPFQRTARRLHLLSITFVTFFVAAINQVQYMDQPLDSPSRVKFIALSNTIIIVYDYLLRELAGCTCFAAGGACEETARCCGCRNFCMAVGSSTLFGFVIVSTILFLASLAWLLALKRFTLFFIELFFFVKAVAYGSWLFVSILWFLWERHRQRKSWREGVPSGAYPFPNLPSPNYFRASWTFCGCNGLCGNDGKQLLGSIDTDGVPRTMHCDVDTENPMHGDHDRGADGHDGHSDEYRDEGEKEDDMREDETKSTLINEGEAADREGAQTRRSSGGLMSYFSRSSSSADDGHVANDNAEEVQEIDFSAAAAVLGGTSSKPIKVRRSPSSASGPAYTGGAPSRFSSSALEEFYSASSSSSAQVEPPAKTGFSSIFGTTAAEKPTSRDTGARASRSHGSAADRLAVRLGR
jgi:hypothetical protein